MSFDTLFEEPSEPHQFLVTTGDVSQHNKPEVIFGGVTNREAVAMVSAEELAAELLKRVNDDWNPAHPHNKDTPRRLVASLKEMCQKPEMDWNFTVFPADRDEMITLGPIPFYSLCRHHVVPFHGNAWVGYVPKSHIAGLSKFARAVKWCAKGLQVQEDLTRDIHEFINEALMGTRGLAVVVKAEHMCMAMRGVQAPGVITTTAMMSGVFGDHSKTAKMEFMHWIGDSK
jgi:GTP cyclohydrolase I